MGRRASVARDMALDARVCLVLACLLVPNQARAEEPERHYVFGLGGAFTLDTADRSAGWGGNAFFEMEAIEGWLEIEAGVSVVKVKTGGEVSSDLLFKKPFRLSRRLEIMIGLGPEIVQTFGAGAGLTYYGVEAAIDLMFWPSQRFGVWVEPTYDLTFRDRASLGFGTTFGPMVGW